MPDLKISSFSELVLIGNSLFYVLTPSSLNIIVSLFDILYLFLKLRLPSHFNLEYTSYENFSLF